MGLLTDTLNSFSETIAPSHTQSIAVPEIPSEWLVPSRHETIDVIAEALDIKEGLEIDNLPFDEPRIKSSGIIVNLLPYYETRRVYGITSLESQHFTPLIYYRGSSLRTINWQETAALEIEAAKKFRIDFNPQNGRLTVFGKDLWKEPLKEYVQRIKLAQNYVREKLN